MTPSLQVGKLSLSFMHLKLWCIIIHQVSVKSKDSIKTRLSENIQWHSHTPSHCLGSDTLWKIISPMDTLLGLYHPTLGSQPSASCLSSDTPCQATSFTHHLFLRRVKTSSSFFSGHHSACHASDPNLTHLHLITLGLNYFRRERKSHTILKLIVRKVRPISWSWKQTERTFTFWILEYILT